MVEEIDRLRKENESLGGKFEVRAFGLVPGHRLARLLEREARRPPRPGDLLDPVGEGRLARRGWEVAGRPGSEAHDEIFWSEERGWYRETNRAGGLEGGMTNGEPLVVQAAIKPISTMTQPLRSVDTETKEPAQAMRERTDSTVVPAAAVVGGGDGRARGGGRLPREVRRRPHRRRARGDRGVRGAHRVAEVGALAPRHRLHRVHGRGQDAAPPRPSPSASGSA